MKTKIKYLLVLVLASFVFVGCTTTFNGSCKAKRWEYKTVFSGSQTADSLLNSYGKDGWVLVSTIPADSNGMNAIFYFKRPKQ